jgi:hypothetical protein
VEKEVSLKEVQHPKKYQVKAPKIETVPVTGSDKKLLENPPKSPKVDKKEDPSEKSPHKINLRS